MTKFQPKKPSDSFVSMTQLVLPGDTNNLNTIFGGQVMSWIDIAAAISAGKHCRRTVVTASFDALHFIEPIQKGQVVTIMAQVNRAFRTSVEIGVRVEAEDLLTGERYHNVSCYATFVALDSNRKPTAVPPVEPQTDEEKIRFEQAMKRREARVALAKELKEHRDSLRMP